MGYAKWPEFNKDYLTRNEINLPIYTPDTPIGETNREDVTSECQWSSSKENIATVENGVITGVSEGVTEITVTSAYGSEKFSVGVGEEVEVCIGNNIFIFQKDDGKIKRITKKALIIQNLQRIYHKLVQVI